MPFIVTNDSKKVVLDLKQEEVSVAEKTEIKAELERFNGPTSYVITLDVSGSFKKLIPAEVKAASDLIQNNRAEDETTIVSFVSSEKIDRLQYFTSDKQELMRSISKLQTMGGQSAIIDALYLSVDAATKSPNQNSRRAVVLFSDGEDRNSFYKYEDLRKLLRQTGVQVFVVGILNLLDKDSGFIRVSPREKAEKFLKNVVEDSHGLLFFPKNPAELDEAVAEIGKSLQVQYYVNFEAPVAKPGEHEVDITVARPNEKLKVSSKALYYIQKPEKEKSKP